MERLAGGGRKSTKMAYEREDKITIEINHCLAYRKFSNLWETTQTLFWAAFGLIDLDNFELTGIKEFTRFWGLIMFGSFSLINIIVLLNLLIAMMNHSYQLISVSSEKADTEWKFARSKLWISYFEEGGTVPPPFNIIPTPKTVYYIARWIYLRMCGASTSMKKQHMKTRKVKQEMERDIKYQAIMRNLVRRYVTQEQRKAENEGVTEDDVNEIKNDISAFRFELIEIMRASGMNIQSASGPAGPGGKKNRQKERRLMKGFHIQSTTVPGTEVSIDMTKAKGKGFSRIAKLVTAGAKEANGNQPETIGKRWPNLADAMKTVREVKVPRIPGVRRTSHDSAILPQSAPITNQNSLEDPGGTRISSNRQSSSQESNRVTHTTGVLPGFSVFDSDVGASTDTVSSVRSLVTEASLSRCNGRLQRTCRIEETETGELDPQPGLERIAHNSNDKAKAPLLWGGSFPPPALEEEDLGDREEEQPLVPPPTHTHTVPDLLPSNNRCPAQTSGWL